jgi:hypothetical protein
VNEQIKAGLVKVLDSHFDVLFRGELIFPRFKVIGYERVDDKTYKARLEFMYLDCTNINQDYILKNEESISKPILPIEMVHIINTQVITWKNKEEADSLNLEPEMIDLIDETEEIYKWNDPRITDDEIEYALSASGFDKESISEDDGLKKSLDEFLASEDQDLEAAKVRLKSFLI